VNVTTEPDAVAALRVFAPEGADIFCDACGAKDQIVLASRVCREGGLWARYAVEPPGGYDEPEGGAPALRREIPEAREHVAYAWVADMLLRGAIDVREFLTHEWPLDDFESAFTAVARGEVLKGLLRIG
jgi:Zn-dependent alcohol dehydrogenase